MKKRGPGLIAAALGVYFLYFALPALSAKFSRDDMTNLGTYWQHGFLGSFWDAEVYRPLGAIFYLPNYYLFGLNPVPYHASALAILAANLVLTFHIAGRLTKSRAASALAVVLVCAHGSMVTLYYSTAMIYDVLAYFFSAAMLYCYLVFRQEKKLTAGRSALVVFLYIGAIESKEIAVVAALWILAYELLFYRPPKLAAPGILALVAMLFAATILFGPHALSKIGGYRLELTPQRFVINNTLYLNDLLHVHFFDSGYKLFQVWIALAGICVIARKRELWWCWFAACTATLPVSFTVQPRDDASLYVPLLALALLASTLSVGLLKRPALQWSVASVAAIAWTYYSVPMWRFSSTAALEDQRLTWRVISQFRALDARPAPHSRVLVLSNPFADWDVAFISSLVWNDRTLFIKLASHLDRPPVLSDYDWVLTFEGETLRVVRRP